MLLLLLLNIVGGPAHAYNESKMAEYLICNKSATVQPIATKFCVNMQSAIADRPESENLHISII